MSEPVVTPEGAPPSPAPASTWTWAQEVRVLGALAAVAMVFVGPLIWRLTAVGGELDWRYFQQLWETDRRSLVEFGQIPFWNPWYCGGNAQLANPQTQFFSLFSPFSWLLGAAVGIKFHILGHYALGMWGTWRLGRAHGLGVLGAFAASTVFCLSGFFAMRAGGGHSAFLPFFLMPWAAYFYLSGLRTLQGGVALGLTLGLMLLEGGMYPFSLTLGMLCFLAAHDLVTSSEKRAVLRTGVVALLTVLPAAAVKLGPLMEFVGEFPRTVPVKDSLNLTRVLSMFVSRSMERNCAGCVYVWPEYINYVGPLVLVVFILSLRRLADARWRRAYVVAACAGLLLIGDHGPASPYVLLHNVPPYDSLRVPGRWAILVVLQMALLFGAFMDGLPAWISRRRPAWAARAPVMAWGLLAAVGLDLMLQNGRLWSPGFKDIPPPVTTEPFRQEKGNAFNAWLDTRRNIGTLDCYEPAQIPTSKGLWTGKTEQVRVEGNAGTARLVTFSPNKLVVEANLTREGTVLINQNHHRLWRVVDGGGEVVSANGVLALKLPAGQQTVTLRYQPTGFWGYALLSLVAWVVGIRLLWRRRQEPFAPFSLAWPLEPAVAGPSLMVAPSPPPMSSTPEPTPPSPDVTAAVVPPEPPPAPRPSRQVAPLGGWIASALVAGVVTGLGLGVVELVDLVMRGVAPASGKVSLALVLSLLDGFAGLGLGILLAVLATLAWPGHRVGRSITAPIRWLQGADVVEKPGAAVFARMGGLLVGALVLAGGVTALVLWSGKAFNARELAAALVGVLGLVVLVVAIVVGAVVEAALWKLASASPLRVLHDDRFVGTMPWVLLGVAAVALGGRAAAPILKGTDLRPAWYPLGTLAAAIALAVLVSSRISRSARVAALAAVVGGILAGAVGLLLVTRVEGGAVAMERGMVASPLVRTLRDVADRDKDGFSSILGGGDCDDASAAVNPRALDVPDNGVDEDCSGEDFHPPPRDLAVHSAALPPGVGPYRNVLFIIVDTLRQDRLHLFGNSRPTTPFLDELANSSAVFTRAYANGVRSHRSIPSILTGRYPSRLHMGPSKTELLTLLPQNVSIAERLGPLGYSAASFILEKYFEGQEGLTQGFDFFNPRRVDPNYRDWSRPQAEGVVNATINWINEQTQAGKPWIAWPHIYDPHLYWHDTPFGTDELARFDAAVRYVDSQVARLVQHVKSLPDGNQTIIVFTADHGQGLGTHGEHGHGQNMWEEDVKVPMLIHAPGFPAQRVDTVVENVDLVPTVLNLLGLTKDVDPMLDGKTLVPFLVSGDAAAKGDPGVAIVEGMTDPKQPHDRRAVVQGPWKLIVDLDVGTMQLFHLPDDPQERKNVAGEHPDRVREMRAILDRHSALSRYIVR
ncbi:MAG: sulfatase-like hydrolase/transferase [Myxococcota bacterium]